MGSKSSKDEKKNLLENEEVFTPDIQTPVFEELNLVLIGSKGAGKNTVANAIFGKKVFTVWTSYKSVHIKTTKVSRTWFNLARVPGWKGELSNSKTTQHEIYRSVQSLYETGPHAVLLVLKVNTVLSKSTINTLESLLTDKLWDHTIVLFTNVKKLGHIPIEKYIHRQQLETFIDKCGQRYCEIKNNDRNLITKKIQELVAEKNSACGFKLTAETEDINTLLTNLQCVVERSKSKITSISTFKEKIINAQNEDSIKKLYSMEAEIKRLKKVVQEKESEIARLQSRTQNSALVQQRRIQELEHQLDMKSKELQEKDAENKQLKKELQKYKTEPNEWRSHENQNTIINFNFVPFSQNFSQTSVKSCTQIPLHDLSSNGGRNVPAGSDLSGWVGALLHSLEDLSDNQLKKFKALMHLEWKIPKSSVEGKDRYELANYIVEKYGERQSVLKTRDLMKEIPRNDDTMTERFKPFLETIGETWHSSVN